MVVFEHVAREFVGPKGERVVALSDFNLEARAGELLVLVGPSGSGKTTALRILAGLEEPTSGTVRLNGKSMAGVKPKERDVAMVFQQPALFPHLTVFKNMAFGLMLRKFPAVEINSRMNKAAEMLNLTKLLDRKPATLSGGEAQRVALGRALARDPKVFLLDEPLSNLDPPLRLQLRGEIAALHRKLGTTMLFVTHDRAEALALADRIAIVKDGVVQQVAAPKEILSKPANAFVAEFMGVAAVT
jgi:multiple sugar transport system ATP-binding protein